MRSAQRQLPLLGGLVLLRRRGRVPRRLAIALEQPADLFDDPFVIAPEFTILLASDRYGGSPP
jgi:hypothetical protein